MCPENTFSFNVYFCEKAFKSNFKQYFKRNSSVTKLIDCQILSKIFCFIYITGFLDARYKVMQ